MSVPYTFGVALRSLRRNLSHTIAIVVVCAMGVVAWTTSMAAVDAFEDVPIQPREGVYRVQLQRAGESPLEDGPRFEPLAYRDRALLASATPTRASDLFFSSGVARRPGSAPFVATVGFATRHLGTMFDLPLAAGAFWSEDADAGRAAEVVLDAAAKRALFGDGEAVGQIIHLYGRAFKVSGVLAALPRRHGPLGSRAVILAPSAFGDSVRAAPSFFLVHEGASRAGGDLRASDNTWLDVWVELDDDAQRARFAAELDAYVEEQRRLGRPLVRATLDSPARIRRPGPGDAGSNLFALFSTVLLGGIALALARFLDVKFHASRSETAIRRAFGASFVAVLGQRLAEGLLVGIASATLAVPGAAAGVAMLNVIIADRPRDYELSARRALVGVACALALALAAALVPAIRSARAVPAEGLRRS